MGAIVKRLCLAAVGLLAVSTAAGALEPDEIAVVAVRQSAESRQLAEYYVEKRGLPADRICLVDVRPGRTLSREEWVTKVRPSIRNWIGERNLTTKLKCLVTVWDVPLKIDRHRAAEPRDVYLAAQKRERLERVARAVAAARRVGEDGEGQKPPTFEDTPLKEVREAVVEELRSAQKRLSELDDAARAEREAAELGQLGLSLLGLGVATRPATGEEPTSERQRASDRLLGRMAGLAEGRAAAEQLPETVARDRQILRLLETRDGLLGSLAWIEGQLALLKKNETYSSFDSELSLLHWPDYPLLRWQPNLLHHRFDGSPVRAERPTLMVARLEAPTFELARGLIDTALEVEKEGLDGTFYVDARGIKPGANRRAGSYGDYDESLRTLAGDVERHSDWKVVLDDEPALFGDGDCPDAALYSGWYSLSKYVDAFEWKRGAVAYHIASGEAATLRNADSQVWCKRMLEDGVCATLGPVHEPYLAAFPRPDEFFPTLLSGEYTLAETYYRTKPFNSWVMTLVGDPLYNPFRGRPGIRADELPERLRQVVSKPRPPESPNDTEIPSDEK